MKALIAVGRAVAIVGVIGVLAWTKAQNADIRCFGKKEGPGHPGQALSRSE